MGCQRRDRPQAQKGIARIVAKIDGIWRRRAVNVHRHVLTFAETFKKNVNEVLSTSSLMMGKFR